MRGTADKPYIKKKRPAIIVGCGGDGPRTATDVSTLEALWNRAACCGLSTGDQRPKAIFRIWSVSEGTTTAPLFVSALSVSDERKKRFGPTSMHACLSPASHGPKTIATARTATPLHNCRPRNGHVPDSRICLSDRVAMFSALPMSLNRGWVNARAHMNRATLPSSDLFTRVPAEGARVLRHRSDSDQREPERGSPLGSCCDWSTD